LDTFDISRAYSMGYMKGLMVWMKVKETNSKEGNA
jgi:hypothetical protein